VKITPRKEKKSYEAEQNVEICEEKNEQERSFLMIGAANSKE